METFEDQRLLEPITTTSRRFWIFTGILSAITLWGFIAWWTQLRRGLSVTGLNSPVFWGLYITNFVFFIGISHAGTLISAILRLAQAEWRRSITRAAEIITVLVLFFGMGCVILDLGRPDRVMNVLRFSNFTSPLLWDVMSVACYLTASTIYLYLPLIPDIAILRDHIPSRRWLYRPLALGWSGTPRQRRILGIAIAVMAVVVIPIAVSVHTVVSWVFAMTVQPMWHSTIFGPYFVVGAIFSGIGAIIIAMAIIRRAYHLEAYLKPIHFNNLGILLLVMALLWFYFTFAEFLTTYYGGEPAHMVIFLSKTEGAFSPFFWTMVVTCFVIPFVLLANHRTRGTVWGTVAASVSVEIGMWLERFLIVVPSLSHPRLAISAAWYTPSWVEWSLFAAFVSTFILLYAVFTKLFPIVSIWEIREGREHSVREVTERVVSYLPAEEKAESRKEKAESRKQKAEGSTVPAFISAFCLLLSAFVAVPLGAATPFGDPMHGQRLFVAKGCVYCHAVRGAGGRIGPDLGRSDVKGSFYELFAAMWNHSPAMDDKVKESRLTRPTFSGDELSDLLAFLYFLNYFDEPGDPRNGKTLFAQKHCIECHAIGREGGTGGPRLDQLARGTPPLQIAQDLWNHGPRMTAMMRARNLQLPTFRGGEIIDLFAYLRTQGQTKSARELRSAGDPEKGRALFSAKGCDRCHALFGRGGGLGPDLGTTELRGSVTQLAGRMWNHWPTMAGAAEAMGMSRPVFRGEELANIFAFLFISRYDATAAAAAQGEEIYVRGGCASCHGMHGEGGIGTPLAKRTTGESKEQIAQRMWNHAGQMRVRMGDRRLPWPRLTAGDLAALIEHLSTLGARQR